ncbi:MAG: linear amide C-N hydrolase [Muribaculaceae bacterium]|nr:linear amide C-N hydrolase [Muribaculaceae bacterium]
MKLRNILMTAGLAVAAMILGNDRAEACTRVVYTGDSTASADVQPLRIVGRSLDWKTPIPTNLYVYPRGMAKKGNTLPGSITWTSKYGAVYAVGYDGGITEGMNEKGLVINGLFCKGTIYNNETNSDLHPMSMAMFVGWLLDMNATTPEVVEVLKNRDFSISGATFDGGTVSALHWGVTDAEGRTAVIEFVNGDINIYEGDYPVLTNDPTFPSMLAINDYWTKVGGANMLPGTVKSPDRFVRASYFVNHVEKTNDPDVGFSIIRSILMNASVPYLYTVESEPNVSSTQWRSFSDITNRRYYFDIVTNPGVYYIDLGKCDLKPGASVLKLDTSRETKIVGEANKYLKKVAPFTPMY